MSVPWSWFSALIGFSKGLAYSWACSGFCSCFIVYNPLGPGPPYAVWSNESDFYFSVWLCPVRNSPGICSITNSPLQKLLTLICFYAWVAWASDASAGGTEKAIWFRNWSILLAGSIFGTTYTWLADLWLTFFSRLGVDRVWNFLTRYGCWLFFFFLLDWSDLYWWRWWCCSEDDLD